MVLINLLSNTAIVKEPQSVNITSGGDVNITFVTKGCVSILAYYEDDSTSPHHQPYNGSSDYLLAQLRLKEVKKDVNITFRAWHQDGGDSAVASCIVRVQGTV